jgi:hypothetical protein
LGFDEQSRPHPDLSGRRTFAYHQVNKELLCRANAILARTGQPFWQDESYDHWARTPEEAEKIIRYIEGNPVAAGLVPQPERWRWSSAFEAEDRPGGLSYI